MPNVFAVTFRAFRFYLDGTESGSTAAAAQDTNEAVNVGAGDLKRHLRVSLAETGSGSISGAATDDYQLQVSVDGGAYGNVTGSSTYVKADTGSGLTDGDATTDRAGEPVDNPGTGSFVAGIQEEADALIANWQLTANNFTEHVFALVLVAADFTVDGSRTLDFRVALNGGSPGITTSVVPRITVTKVPTPKPINILVAQSVGRSVTW